VLAAPLAGTPLFRHFRVADGLPSSVVYELAEDRDGFVWIGTHDGLARYDGVGFRVYRNDPADPASLAGNEVSALFVDRDDRIWAGGEGSGLNCLDTARRGFRHFRHADGDPDSLAADDVWAITQDAAGALWVGSYSGGLDRLREDGTGFAHLRHVEGDPASLASDTVLSLLPASDGGLWIGTDVGLDRRYPDGRIAHVALDAMRGGDAAPPNVMALLADGERVLAATALGLLKVGADLGVRRMDAGADARRLYGLARDRDDELWIATRHGLVRRTPDGDVAAYTAQPFVPGGLPSGNLFDVLADSAGGLWLATLDGGLAHLPPDWRRFSQFRHLPDGADGLSRGRLTGTALAADGAVWVVGNEGAIERIDPRDGRIEHWAERAGPPDRRLWSVLVDRRGRLWIGQQRGLRRYDPATGAALDFPVDAQRADALPGAPVDLLLEAGDAVWASARGGGLVRIETESGRLVRYAADTASGLRDADVERLALAPDGSLWVAHGKGLDRYDPASGRFAPVPGAPEERVQALAFAADGLWLHRFGALEHYRLAGGRLERRGRIDARDGWPALEAGGLAIDARSRLWVTTPRGLYRVDPATRTVRRFDGSDGLASPEFVDRSLLRRDDGVLVAATLAGLVAFDPRTFEAVPAAPPLVLVSASVRRDGRRIELDPAAPLDLRWDDRDLRLSARALAYAGTNRYQFRLEPLEADWSEAQALGEREYAGLPPGDYRLTARAAQADGPWQVTAPLAAHVAPPPWATSWAKLGYALIAAAIAAGLLLAWRSRIVRRHAYALAEQRRQLAEQASQAKSDFLAHMGHEIRTPMTGVLGMSELLERTPLDERQRGYVAALRRSGEHMLRLVNDALDLARIEAGRIDLCDEPFAPAQLLDEVAASLQPLALVKGIALVARCLPGVPRTLRGDAGRVRQILLNLGGNAVKFTSEGRVTLELDSLPEASLVLRVRDTGPGLDAGQHSRLFQRFSQTEIGRRAGGSGLGLVICRELAEHMGGRIELDSEPGVGSEFRAYLPLPVVDEEAVPADPSGGTPLRRAGGGPLELLLVEDDPTVAEVVGSLLTGLGHRVRHVPNALAALGEIARGDLDAALLDLDLPGMDGIALAGLIRGREAAQAVPCLPLIALTARSDPDSAQAARAAGMDAFLRKPVTAAMLASVLADVAPGPDRTGPDGQPSPD